MTLKKWVHDPMILGHDKGHGDSRYMVLGPDHVKPEGL